MVVSSTNLNLNDIENTPARSVGYSSSESPNVIFVDLGASAVISLKWEPYIFDSCQKKD
jgi:hypothetical protein